MPDPDDESTEETERQSNEIMAFAAETDPEGAERYRQFAALLMLERDRAAYEAAKARDDLDAYDAALERLRPIMENNPEMTVGDAMKLLEDEGR